MGVILLEIIRTTQKRKKDTLYMPSHRCAQILNPTPYIQI